MKKPFKPNRIHQALESLIFSSRWILYPINVGLLLALGLYVTQFLKEDWHFLSEGFNYNLESLMLLMLGLVDASMVANLIIMIIQGGHQIFISKFNLANGEDKPQYLDHIDTGILKVKVALSISGITLVQLLRDFVNIEKVEWHLVQQRMIIHGVTLLSALIMALIWRVTHPSTNGEEHA